MWFAAHIVMSLQLTSEEQHLFPVWENIVLIEAETRDEAGHKAKQIGETEQLVDDGSTLDGKPARWIYVGVRKIISCEDENRPPSHATEISYSEYLLDSLDEVNRLARGEPVELTYNE